jgi:hypothetical protein
MKSYLLSPQLFYYMFIEKTVKIIFSEKDDKIRFYLFFKICDKIYEKPG